MPPFLVEYVRDEDGKTGTVEADLPLDDAEFRSRLLDLEEELFRELGQTASVCLITAVGEVTEGVNGGDVVWRDWNDLKVYKKRDRLEAIEALRASKRLWKDRGRGYADLVDQVTMEEREAQRYGLTEDDGYLIVPEDS